MENNKFGELIKSLRIGMGLSLRAIAEKADVSHSYLSQIELGKRGVPSPEIIKRLALALEFDYFTLARAAGYLNSEGHVTTPNNEVPAGQVTLQGIEFLSEKEVNTIQFSMPGAIKEDLEDGKTRYTVISPEESKRWFLDLNYLLRRDEDIYFKQKLLNEKEKNKILKMLELIIEDN